MTPEQYEQVRSVFERACELPAPERGAYVERTCAGDPVVRSKVVAMLREESQSTSMFETPVFGAGFRVDAVLEGETPVRIDQYRILSLLGAGGMGRVYKGLQEHPRRTVAIKLLRAGLISAQMQKRFEHEVHVLGQLKHPGIAQIYDAGSFESAMGEQPFFVMEFIAGKPLIRHAIEHGLDTRDRLRLLSLACDAVNHAHQRGIIHRDLKPDNILVDADGQPKILDFGVARMTDADVMITTIQTNVGQLVGTLAYMSPEQVRGRPEELDSRSDVYALGLIGFELLADRMPYAIKDQLAPEVMRVICEDEPTQLSSVDRALRGDVTTIIAKALEKDPARRYQTVHAFADDIRRHLDDEPINARPASMAYQLSKFARRNTALVGGVLATFVVLVVSLIVISSALARAIEAEEAANSEARNATDKATEAEAISGFLQEIFMAARPSDGGKQDVKVREVLAQSAERLETRFEDRPLIKAMLHATLARTYRELDLGEDAEAQYLKSIEVYREHAVEEEALQALGSTLNGLAMLYRRTSETEVSVRYFEEAAALHARVLGDDHIEYGAVLNNVGNAYVRLGQFEKAEAALRRSYEIHRDLEEPNGFGPGLVTTSYGLALGKLGRWEEAEARHREALEMLATAVPPEHPVNGRAYGDLALALAAQEKYDEAIGAVTRSVELFANAYGPDGAFTNFARITHMDVLLRARRGLEAESVMDDYTPKDDADRALLARRRAQALVLQDRPDEAESALLDAYAAAGRILTTIDSEMSTQLAFEQRNIAHDLVEFYTTLGQTADAERWTTRAASQ